VFVGPSFHCLSGRHPLLGEFHNVFWGCSFNGVAT
jgi:hypothetical protein